MENVQRSGFMRLKEVLKFIGVGKTTWYKGVKSGRYPKSFKLSERCTGWDELEIRMLKAQILEQDGNPTPPAP